ncbi:hypothetical protein HMPREF1531_01753 [Propionibacterium sp. oral taxon 192 str. F0372]|uniref:RDD family protein n=1 Tax=Propionibacterium sp. oral taxon 192 TaxID=671222 RepID=UPI000353E1AC|nr:RDD family protein [Propionibacterium sp. oral taxon 192]EPH02447.1 hypothetical protein HMPREF1531_01753 [Propionibacterium sp. oral taxon 192 str. F0372]
MSESEDTDRMLPPAGWYSDPVGCQGYRWWDGTSWTNDTRDAASTPVAPAANPHRADAPLPGSAPAIQPRPFAVIPGPATADGVPLAGWWRRAGGLAIDAMVVGMLTALVFWPFSADLVEGLNRFMDDVWRSAQTGGQTPDPYATTYGLGASMQQLTLVQLVVGFIYSAGMQLWRSATLGMLILGMRVVPLDRGREHHGLPMREALLRNLLYQALSLLTITALLNGGIPLMNPRRQGLHDMVARTQVVRIR